MPSVLENPVYSLDGGISYFPWVSPLILGTLSAYTSRTILIRGTLSASAAGEIVNTAVAGSTTPDPNPDNNTSTDITPIQTSTDLSIIKTAEPSPALAGGRLNYTLLISNRGPGTAEQVILRDPIPDELDYVELSADNGSTWIPFSGTFLIGDMAAGASIRLLIRAMISPCAFGTIINTAEVSSNTPDPDLSNNTSTAETPVIPSADLSVVKSSSPNPAEPGGVLTYTLTVTNAGPSDAANVRILDTVPSELDNVEFSLDGGVLWQPWPGALTLGTLPAGAVSVILLRGTVSLLTGGSTITNFAVVTSDTPDPDSSNNVDRDMIDIIREFSADLSVTKRADTTLAVPGEPLTYSVVITNYGPDPEENVILYDEIYPGLSDAQFSTDGGATWNPWFNPYRAGLLEPGESVTILIRGPVTASVCGTLCNTAVVTGSAADPNPDNNTDSICIPVSTGADLCIEKRACPNPASNCGCLTFTLTISNTGPETARQVVVTDLIPPELCRPVYSTDNGFTWCPWTGGCISLLIKGTVDACAAGCIINTAAVSAQTPDPDPFNNQACVMVRLR